MVRYSDPEDCVDAREASSRSRSSDAEKRARLREKNARLTGSAAIEAAREVALRRLDVRAHSRAQLYSAMTTRGFSPDVAHEVLSRLERVGLVDDLAYATAVVNARFALSGKVGPALIRDLQQKGLPPDIIAQALADMDHEDAIARARQLVSAKRRTVARLEPHVARRRLSAMLARKGYSASVVTQVVDEALNEWADEYDERPHL